MIQVLWLTLSLKRKKCKPILKEQWLTDILKRHALSFKSQFWIWLLCHGEALHTLLILRVVYSERGNAMGGVWLNITTAKISYPPSTYQWKAASLENTMCTTTTLKGSFHSVLYARALSLTGIWTDSLTVSPTPLPFLWSSFTKCSHLSGRKRQQNRAVMQGLLLLPPKSFKRRLLAGGHFFIVWETSVLSSQQLHNFIFLLAVG